MTIFSSGISMYAMAKLIQTLHVLDAPLPGASACQCRASFHVSIVVSALIVLAYIFLGGLTSAIYNEVLQFFLIVAGFLAAGLAGSEECWRVEWTESHSSPRPTLHSWQGMGNRAHESAGSGMVRAGDGLGLRALVRLLVHGFPGDSARHGGGFDERGAPHAADRGVSEDGVSVSGDSAGADRDRAAHATSTIVPSMQSASSALDEAGRTRAGSGLIPAKMDPTTGQRAAGCRRQTRARLRPGDSEHAAALFPHGHSGTGPDRAAGQLHVRHGRQRDGVQHRLDVRHLPVAISSQRRSDRALPVDGAVGHGRLEFCFRLPLRMPPRASTTSWTCCNSCSRS